MSLLSSHAKQQPLIDSGTNNPQMPAELFPTRYRGLSHGISAAFGKLGSVVAQLFLGWINYGQNGESIDYAHTIQKWLPYSLLMYHPSSPPPFNPLTTKMCEY